MALECVCVGDRLGSTAQYAPGASTYVKDGYIYAKSVGRQQISPGEGAEVRASLACVTLVGAPAAAACCAASALRRAKAAASSFSSPPHTTTSLQQQRQQKPSLEVLPLRPREQIAIGSVVFARVERITPTHAHARLLCVGAGDVLGDNFRGVVRLQDVRRTEIDKVLTCLCVLFVLLVVLGGVCVQRRLCVPCCVL
jgi:exosome complex RNA-binding protein Csl4